MGGWVGVGVCGLLKRRRDDKRSWAGREEVRFAAGCSSPGKQRITVARRKERRGGQRTQPHTAMRLARTPHPPHKPLSPSPPAYCLPSCSTPGGQQRVQVCAAAGCGGSQPGHLPLSIRIRGMAPRLRGGEAREGGGEGGRPCCSCRWGLGFPGMWRPSLPRPAVSIPSMLILIPRPPAGAGAPHPTTQIHT